MVGLHKERHELGSEEKPKPTKQQKEFNKIKFMTGQAISDEELKKQLRAAGVPPDVIDAIGSDVPDDDET